VPSPQKARACRGTRAPHPLPHGGARTSMHKDMRTKVCTQTWGGFTGGVKSSRRLPSFTDSLSINTENVLSLRITRVYKCVSLSARTFHA
jgi:hypothetical protein